MKNSKCIYRLTVSAFLMILTGLVPSVAVAQTDSTAAAKTESEEDTTAKAWEVSINLGLNLSHTMQINGVANTGKLGFSTTNGIDFNVNYTKNRIISTNEFHWQFSLYKAGLKSIMQKTADELLSLHDLSVGFAEDRRWNVNVIAKTKTGIFSTYEDGMFRDTTGSGTLVQSFLNPYELILSPGIKWQPTKAFRVSLSPYTFRFYGLISQTIANTGLYIEDKQPNGRDYVKRITEQQGAELNVWYDRKLKKWLQMQYRLAIKSNYAETILDNGTLDGLFITKVKLIKNIYLTHRATLRGKLEEKPFKPVYIQVITLSYAVVF
ncbi:MAG: hypothetical protein U0X91_07955 [Spirosomataceae bacterium]